MSEQTGATREQIEAAALADIATWHSSYEPVTEETKQASIAEMETYARFLVPPGYRIVPADAVVVTPEIAATAAEACLARGTEVLGEWETFEQARQCEQRSARYRAAAAFLRGGKSPNVTSEQNAWAEIEGGSIERAEAEAAALRGEG